ncbi:hypothetical protein ACH4SP_16365 [Streptomyces sp. NPDC021093]|uniref:hypothetical protein n=1 Tax=Streptomyces sp. NPDC021093 TaxID=3365112 RepID=UPI0037A67831
MGGLRHFRTRGTSAHAARVRRGVALLCAVAALLGALLVCLTPARAETAAPPSAAYNCPYDQGGCGLFPHAAPAVLTVPPLDTPPGAVALPVRHGGDGGTAKVARGDGTWARAPGPYVLMVLRR